MECIFVFFFGVFIFFVMSAQGASKSRHAQVFRRLAKRYHGAFMPGGFFRKPTIRFRYGETTVTLQYMEPRRDRFGPVQVRIKWPDRALLLEVFPDEGNQSHLQTAPRAGARFDEEFVVRSNNEVTARQWLSPAVQTSIRKLRRSGVNWQVYLSLVRGQLTIQKHIGINYQSLDAFILSAMEIYDQAMLNQVAGIEFVAGEDMVCEPSKEQGEAVCRICCDSIESDIVFCPRCRTPHHRDCWEYNGACSTYGCQETEYVASMDHDVLG